MKIIDTIEELKEIRKQSQKRKKGFYFLSLHLFSYYMEL